MKVLLVTALALYSTDLSFVTNKQIPTPITMMLSIYMRINI